MKEFEPVVAALAAAAAVVWALGFAIDVLFLGNFGGISW